ncbi:tail fiber protein [Hymenobacter sp. M29]|uniref:Tail fiber protein n=1 Tax=Hymenobacter mellowenesis TaxID=3063995 RepID=A0ABT9A9W7_9BACT|nr:tail fiber protein [Hymenobacter sp. M29]MDO7846169.1 tail fiber protein [Hymenobacter sp. M29]
MENYVGEIRIFAGTFAPATWLDCNGQQLSISEYEVLYALIGTTYGGDGQTTFGLPDLRSRAVVGMGQGRGLSNFTQGEMTGTENVQLSVSNLPSHQHPLANGSLRGITGAGGQTSPSGAYFGDQGGDLYSNVASDSTLASDALAMQLTPAGGAGQHPNLQPYLTMRYIIATQGIFPSQP